MQESLTRGSGRKKIYATVTKSTDKMMARMQCRRNH